MTDDEKPNPTARAKLVRSKEKWAQEGRLLTGRPDLGHVNRLPPGQNPRWTSVVGYPEAIHMSEQSGPGQSA